MSNLITLYEIYNTVSTYYEKTWATFVPTKSHLNGDAINTSIIATYDQLELNNTVNVGTGPTTVNLTNVQLVKVNSSGGAITLVLPDYTNQIYKSAFYYVEIVNATNAITVQTFNGTQYIDDGILTSKSFTFQEQSLTFKYDSELGMWSTDPLNVGKFAPQKSVISMDNYVLFDGNGSIDAQSNKIINLATPTSAGDAVSKTYVDVLTNNLAIHNVITVGKNSTGQYQSITTALAAIGTTYPAASISNTYKIEIGPGTYTESPLTMKPYVYLFGSGEEITIISPVLTTDTIIIACASSYICNLQITGASGAGGKGISINNLNNMTPFRINQITLGNNETNINITNSVVSQFSVIKISNCIFGGTNNFITGIYTESTNGGFAIVSIDNLTFIDIVNPYPTTLFDFRGAGSQVILTNIVARNGNANAGLTDIAVNVQNGAEVRILSSSFRGFDYSINNPNVGTGAVIFVSGCYFEKSGSTGSKNINVLHASTTGSFTGYVSYDSVNIVSGSTFFITYKDPKIINVNKTGGDFSSIKAAADSITDASETNRYVIKVGPGLFIEDTINLSGKPYISVVGNSILSTVVQPTNSTQHIFQIGNVNELSFLFLKNAGSGYAGIYMNDGGDYGQAHKITFVDCDIGILVTSTSVTTTENQFYGEYIDMNGTFSYAVKVDNYNAGVSISNISVNLENFYVFPTSADSIGVYVKGNAVSNSTYVDILSSGFVGFGSTSAETAVLIENNVNCNITATYIQNYYNAIDNPNSGLASKITMSGVNLTGNVNDILINKADTTGSFQGSASYSKITSVAPSFAWNFTDVETGSFEITKKLNMTFDDVNNTRTDLSTLILEGSTMGVFEGGVITLVSGLQINISTGFGYVDDQSSDVIKRLDWNSTNLTLAANSSLYIYFTFTGTLTSNTTYPNTNNNIVLGKVVTDATNILFIENIPLIAHHPGNLDDKFQANAFGPIYQSGSLVTESGTVFQLNISSGIYYLSRNRFAPSGGSNIPFKTFYRNGSGGWTINSLTPGVVNNTDWDDNTGTLNTLTTSYYVKHSLYVVGSGIYEKYFLVLGQAEYATVVAAEGGNIALPPSYFSDSVCLIANIIIKQGNSTIYEIQDARPVIGFKTTGVSATATHANLLGLSADDHTQYLLTSGARAMGGNLDMGGNSITNINLVDGIDVNAHASRHLPGGADPLTTAAPVDIGTVNAIGNANSFARSDHIHNHGNLAGGLLHAIAVAGVSDGFLSATDKTKLDGLGDHNTLTNLTVGDVHTQYVYISGRAGGQIITGGSAASNNLTLQSTSAITKGSVIIGETTNSTAYTNGSLVINGGVGIASNLFSNGNASFAGAGGVTSSLISGSSSAPGALTIRANSADTTGTITVVSALNSTLTTDSTSSSSGSIVTSGGVGIAKKLYVGDTTAATSNAAGSAVFAGGLAVGKTTYIGDTTTNSTNSTSGSLILPGSSGLGVGGNIYGNGLLNIANSITSTTGNIVSSAGSVSAATTITAGTGITVTSGNIVASSGNISSSGSITAGNSLTVTTGNLLVSTGNINTTSGTITSGSSISSTTNITAGTTLNAGNISINATANTISSTNTNGNINLSPNGVGEVILARLPIASLSAAPKSYVGYGNIFRVDKTYGNDTTALTSVGSCFLTISAAITAASAGTTILVFPGTYNETITMKTGVDVIGIDKRVCVIERTGVTADTTLITMAVTSNIENFTLNLTTSGAFNLTGISLTSTTTDSTIIKNINLTVSNTNTGAFNCIGILSSGTGQPLAYKYNIIDTDIIITSSTITTGLNHALVTTTAASYVRCYGCNFVVTTNTANVGNDAAVRSNFAGSIISLNQCQCSGLESDIRQTLGSIVLYNTKLLTNNAGGLGFTSLSDVTKYVYALTGAIATGTNGIYLGTTTAATGTPNQAAYTITKPCVLHKMYIQVSAPITGTTLTNYYQIEIYKNFTQIAADPNGFYIRLDNAITSTATVTTPVILNSDSTGTFYGTAKSVTFNIGDTILVRSVRLGTPGSVNAWPRITLDFY